MSTMEQVETGLAVAVSWVGNPLSMWLAINRKPFGWWIVAGTQTAFVAFAVIGQHWEFGGQVLCLIMGVYGVWKWQIRRTHEPAIGRAIPEPRTPLDTNGASLRDTEPRLLLALVELGDEYGPLGVARSAIQVMADVDGARQLGLDAFPPVGRPISTRGQLRPANVRLVAAGGGPLASVADDAISALHQFDREAAAGLRDRLELVKLEDSE